MKLKIRTLKNERYEIEVDPTMTVDQLKDLIEQSHKFEKSSQSLIFAGKVLPNEKTIEECKIGSEDFLVLLVKKVSGKPAAATPEKSTATTQPVSTPAAEKPSTVPTLTTATGDTDVSKQSESVFAGAELEKSINGIVEMGFPRDQVIAAMRASFNNPARAVEYLTTGIPPEVTPQVPQTRIQRPPASAQTGAQASTSAPAPQPSTPAPQPSTSAPAPQAPQGGSVFDGLRQHPQFPQLCMLAQQGGEEALKQILTYFAQTNRPLLELIMQNQDEFIRLLNTPVPGAQGFQGGTGVAPGVIRVQVTPEDERVINNLVNMGFERNRVMEAYFLFEKDETLTANYLLNNPEFDGDGTGDTGSQ